MCRFFYVHMYRMSLLLLLGLLTCIGMLSKWAWFWLSPSLLCFMAFHCFRLLPSSTHTRVDHVVDDGGGDDAPRRREDVASAVMTSKKKEEILCVHKEEEIRKKKEKTNFLIVFSLSNQEGG